MKIAHYFAHYEDGKFEYKHWKYMPHHDFGENAKFNVYKFSSVRVIR